MMEAMQDTEQPAGNAAQKLKIYCETSFWSYLVGGPTSDTLPKTVSIVARAGYECPAIITPEDFFNRREEFEL